MRVLFFVATLTAAPAIAAPPKTVRFAAPLDGDVVEATLGVPAIPRVAFHHPIGDRLSLGGALELDASYYDVASGFSAGLGALAPVRISLVHEGSVSLGVTLEPGLHLDFSPFVVGVLLGAKVDVGFALDDRLVVGVGADAPLGLFFAELGVAGALPLLFGPVGEWRLDDRLSFTLEAKLGPWIGFGEAASGLELGLRVAAGAALRL